MGNKDELMGGWKKSFLVTSSPRRPFQKVCARMGRSCNAVAPAALQTAPARGPGAFPGATKQKRLQRHHWCNTQGHMRSPTGCYHLSLINFYLKKKEKEQAASWHRRCSEHGGISFCIITNGSYRGFPAWSVRSWIIFVSGLWIRS